MPIKVAFGATNLLKGLANNGIDGIGHYCQELLNQFSHSCDLQITTYNFGGKNTQLSSLSLPPYPRYALESFCKLAIDPVCSNKNESFDRFDIVHSTDQLIPIITRTPLIATVMDVIPITHPHLTPSKIAKLKAVVWARLTRSADHIITISEYSKQQIAKHMQYPLNKITVTPLGVNQRYFDRLDQVTINSVLDKFNLPKKFFLHIGTIQPRKNIINLLKAHSQLPFDYSTTFPIVLAGKYGWGDDHQFRVITQALRDGRCIWINYVSDLEKRALLQTTLAMTFISLYEGFGLPIVEAFASQAPVITSANSSMIEVAGDAALLVDPDSIDEIKKAMIEHIENQDSQSALLELGLAQARKCTWENTASLTKAVYQNFA